MKHDIAATRDRTLQLLTVTVHKIASWFFDVHTVSTDARLANTHPSN